MKHYDYLGFSINVGTEVVFIETSYRNYKRGTVVRVGDKKATVMFTDRYSREHETTRYYSDLIKVYIDKD